MRDVFISYSRKDKSFVEQLHQALEAQNRDAWVDWEDIPLSAEWWHEIQRGIESANTFVFVISRDSIESKVCRDEIEHAVQHNKRLVPIVRRDDFEMAKVHPNLSMHNWLFFRETDEFESGMRVLLKAIDTDLEYVRAHTRILEKAIEWQEQKRNESFGLKGDDLRSAEAWLSQGETKEPKPTELQQNYIRASRSTEDANEEARQILVRAEQQAKEQLAKAESDLAVVTRKANRRNLISVLGIGAAVAVSAIAVPSSFRAESARKTAETEVQKAKEQKDSLQIQSDQLTARLNQTQKKEKEAQQKAQLAQKQYQQAQQKEKEARSQAEQAAQQAQAAQQRFASAQQQAAAAQVSLNQVNQEKVQAEAAKQQAEAKSQQAQQQAEQARQQAEQAKVAQAEAHNAQQIAIAGTELERKGVVMLRLPFEQYRNVETLIAAMRLGRNTQALLKHGNPPKSINNYPAVSPLLVLRIAVNSVMQQAEFQGDAAQFSPDGQHIATVDGMTVRLYDLTGKQLGQYQGSFIPIPELSDRAMPPIFSGDSKQLLDGSPLSPTSRLFDIAGHLQAELQGREPSFSPDGKFILTTTDNTTRLYDHRGNFLAQFRGKDVRFSRDHQQILTVDNNLVRRYDLSGKQLEQFQGTDPSISPDSNYVATIGTDAPSIWLYKLTGTPPLQLKGFESLYMLQPNFSPNGQHLVAGTGSQSQLYDLTNQQLTFLQGGDPQFSPDGKHVVTTEYNQPIRLYDLTGQQLAQFQGKFPRFSANSQIILAEGDLPTLYDLKGQPIAQLKSGNTQFSPDGNHIVVETSSISWLYDLTGKLLAQFQGGSLRLSTDGKKVLTGVKNRSRLFTLTSKPLLTPLAPRAEPQELPSALKDNQFTVGRVGSDELTHTTTIMQDASGKQLAQFQGSILHFSHDGRFVLSGENQMVWLYDSMGKQIAQFQGSSAQFNADGQQMVIGNDQTSRLYDLTGKQLLEVPGRNPRFSVDQRSLLTTFPDENMSRLYDLKGNLLAEYLGATVSDKPLGFTQDGKQLLTQMSDGKQVVWDIDHGLDDLLQRGCEQLKNFRQREDVRKVCPGE
ncbi:MULTISPECIES: TIR domain-containing protein [Leptolyngbya]|uniref:TIR domain-containing protein n=1 Tax=Leptolyngbya TaxID=47251 RepID=UPI001682E93B|nr:TIR domain-containing protein [Leptolyngbya sp. FACHB-1624]MBD1859678.1 TIR domain-containing protein [Leptolyngbya sp. FACHB-1624]